MHLTLIHSVVLSSFMWCSPCGVWQMQETLEPTNYIAAQIYMHAQNVDAET